MIKSVTFGHLAFCFLKFFSFSLFRADISTLAMKTIGSLKIECEISIRFWPPLNKKHFSTINEYFYSLKYFFRCLYHLFYIVKISFVMEKKKQSINEKNNIWFKSSFLSLRKTNQNARKHFVFSQFSIKYFFVDFFFDLFK